MRPLGVAGSYLVELPPGMRPAADGHQAPTMQATVAGIGVGLEVSREVALEEPLGPASAAIGRVIVDDERVIPVIEVGPEAAV
jgi:hypothetical protein